MIYVQRSSCKVSAVLFRCVWNLTFLDIFSNNTQSNFTKICLVGAELSYAIGQTDRQIWRSNGRFSQFLRKRLNNVLVLMHIYIYICMFSLAQQPLVAQGIIIKTPRSHSDTSHTVGLLWTSDQPDTKTKQNTLKTQTFMFLAGFEPTIVTSLIIRRPTSSTVWPLGSAEM